MTALRAGFVWALLATLAFGLTTPLIALVGGQTGPWFTVMWLYAGAAAFAATTGTAPAQLLRGVRTHAIRLAVIGAVGGLIAPVLYVVGLRDAGPLAASLALNMEAPLGAAIAVWILHEQISPRVTAALIAIVAGASILALGQHLSATTPSGARGIGLVVAATAFWAVDNALCARLNDLDPRATTFWKGIIGSGLAAILGLGAHEPLGGAPAIAGLVLIGVGGYGASLLLYLIAQRRFGVMRTASIFAAAPLVGALGGVLESGHLPGPSTIAAFAAMLVGIALHAGERHAHEHAHPALEHDHSHRHDDLHHSHVHPTPIVGEHRHAHAHPRLVHAHEHAPDRDHTHRH